MNEILAHFIVLVCILLLAVRNGKPSEVSTSGREITTPFKYNASMQAPSYIRNRRNISPLDIRTAEVLQAYPFLTDAQARKMAALQFVTAVPIMTTVPTENCTTWPKKSNSNSGGVEVRPTLQRLLADGTRQLDLNPQHRNVILVLGNTGSGKTTVTQILAGNLSRLHAVKTSGGGMVIIDDDDRIGLPTTKSKTLIPELVVSKYTDSDGHSVTTAFYDCPGFSDSRGAEMDIAATYFTKSVTNYATSVKLLFLVIHSSVQLGYDRLDFARLVNHAATFVKNMIKSRQAIGLVVTKVNGFASTDGSYLHDSTIIEGIVEFLQEFRESVVQQNNSTRIESPIEKSMLENKLAFLDALLDQDENGTYFKIGFVRSPNKCGPLSEMGGIRKSKEKLTELYSNLQFIENTHDSFGFTLRPESVLKVIEYESELQDKLIQMGEKVFEHFDTLIESNNSKGVSLNAKLTGAKARVTLFSEIMENLQKCNNTKTFISILNKMSTRLNTHIPFEVERKLIMNEGYLTFFEDVTHKKKQREFKKLSPFASSLRESSFKMKKWYEFIFSIHDQVGKYRVQGGVARNLYSSSQSSDDLTFVNSTIQKVPEEIMQIFEMFPSHSEDGLLLREILQFAFAPSTAICESSMGTEKLSIQGNFVRLSEHFVNGNPKLECFPKIVTIVAGHTIFVDADVLAIGQNMEMSIISPNWEVIGSHEFNLDGFNAESLSRITIFGGSGSSGNTGGNGGNFVGVGQNFVNGGNLTIFANGGRGGDGQDGGHGMPGSNGRDISYYRDFSSCLNINQNDLVGSIIIVSGASRSINGPYGSRGGPGGNGGDPGIGGMEGHVKLISQDRVAHQIRIVANRGENGNPGNGGVGGFGGKRGNGLKCDIIWLFFLCKFMGCSTIWNSETALNGISGSTGSLLITDIITPPPLDTQPSLASSINMYKAFALQNMNPVGDLEFFHWLKSAPPTTQIYDTTSLAEEVLLAVENYDYLEGHEEFVSLYLHSLLNRIENHVTTINTVESTKIGIFLYISVLSKLAQVNKSYGPTTAVDTAGYFSAMSANINSFISSDKALALKNINANFEKEVNSQSFRILETVSELNSEISSIQTEVEKQTNIFLMEVVNSIQSKVEVKRNEISTSWDLHSALKIIKAIGAGLSFFGDKGALLGKFISTGSTVADSFLSSNIKSHVIKPRTENNTTFKNEEVEGLERLEIVINATQMALTNASAISGLNFSNLFEVIEQSQDVLRRLKSEEVSVGILNYLQSLQTSNHLEKSLNSAVNNLSVLEIGDKVIAKVQAAFNIAKNVFHFTELGLDSYRRLGEDVMREAQVDVSSPLNGKLADFEERVYQNFIPLFQEMELEVGNLTFPFANGDMHLAKHKIHLILANIRQEIRSMSTIGDSNEGQLVSILDKLEQTILQVIQLYSDIASYHDQKRLADYIAEIHSEQVGRIRIEDKQLSTILSRLNHRMNLDLLLSKYRTGLVTFAQWVFPFADMYLQDLVLPPTFPLLNITQANYLLTERISKIGQMLTQYKSQIVGRQDTFLIHTRFSSALQSSQAFHTWKNSEWGNSIKKLLNGEKVQLLANIESSPNGKDAIKFREIELTFKFKEKYGIDKIEADFKDKLLNFGVSLTHSGLSYYRFKSEYFLLLSENVTIRYNFEKHDGQYTGSNVVMEKLKKGDYLLSPFTMWTIQMYPVNNVGRFTDLQRFGSSVDLALEGMGTYVENEGIKHNLHLKKYYAVDDLQRWDGIVEEDE